MEFGIQDSGTEVVLGLDTRSSARTRLLRVLGVGFGLAVAIGTTIGAGILRTPGEIAALLPQPTLFMAVWVAGGLYALVGAIQIAELGAMLPRSGGQYVFCRYALGNYAGFIVGWSDWLSTCGTTAAVSIVIGEFTGALLPAVGGATSTIAVSVATVFALVQWQGIRWGSGVQIVTSAIKAAAFAGLTVAAFALGGDGTPRPPAALSAPTGIALTTAFVLALQSVIYTYDGWTGVVYFSEEVRNPDTDIPRAVLGGVVAVIVIYLLINLALLYALGIAGMAGQQFAAGTLATSIFGQLGDPVFRVITILAMLSAVNSNHLMASRVLFAMSRDGLFAPQAAAVNTGGTPATTLFLSTLAALLFIVFGRTFQQVITILAFFFVANYSLSFTSLFVLRRREPTLPRPYRAWGYPWTTGVALAGSVAFLVGAIASDTRNSVYALLLLAISYPVFRLTSDNVKSDRERSPGHKGHEGH